MNKNKIAIAVFAAMALVSTATADIVFAGFNEKESGILRNISFEIKSGADQDAALTVPEPGLPALYNNTTAILLGSNKGDLASNPDWFIKAAIAYSEGNRKFEIRDSLIKLLRKGTPEEKSAFVYHKDGEYMFPERLVSRNFVPQICASSHQEQQCHNQLVCNIVCDAAAGAIGSGAGPAAGAAIGAGAAVCHEVCKNVPNCSNITVCDQWVDAPQTHGTDSHGHWE